MKKIFTLIGLGLALLSCKNDKSYNADSNAMKARATTSIGVEFSETEVITTERMKYNYKIMRVGDTLSTKLQAKIIEVCSRKGCWMTLDLGDTTNMMVKFKDYGFFMPLDASGDVVVNGKAYVSETSVEALKHYAEDAGKSKEDIAAITQPKRTYGFEAEGVLLKN